MDDRFYLQLCIYNSRTGFLKISINTLDNICSVQSKLLASYENLFDDTKQYRFYLILSSPINKSLSVGKCLLDSQFIIPDLIALEAEYMGPVFIAFEENMPSMRAMESARGAYNNNRWMYQINSSIEEGSCVHDFCGYHHLQESFLVSSGTSSNGAVIKHSLTEILFAKLTSEARLQNTLKKQIIGQKNNEYWKDFQCLLVGETLWICPNSVKGTPEGEKLLSLIQISKNSSIKRHDSIPCAFVITDFSYEDSIIFKCPNSDVYRDWINAMTNLESEPSDYHNISIIQAEQFNSSNQLGKCQHYLEVLGDHNETSNKLQNDTKNNTSQRRNTQLNSSKEFKYHCLFESIYLKYLLQLWNLEIKQNLSTWPFLNDLREKSILENLLTIPFFPRVREIAPLSHMGHGEVIAASGVLFRCQRPADFNEVVGSYPQVSPDILLGTGNEWRRHFAVLFNWFGRGLIMLFDPLVSANLSLKIQLTRMKQISVTNFDPRCVDFVDTRNLIYQIRPEGSAETDDNSITRRWIDQIAPFCPTSCLVEKIITCGYLQKRGRVNTAFKKRWFVLLGDNFNHFKMRYFVDQHGTLKGEIDVSEIRSLIIGSDKKFTSNPERVSMFRSVRLTNESNQSSKSTINRSFSLTGSESDRVWTLLADTLDDAARWLGHLKVAISSNTNVIEN